MDLLLATSPQSVAGQHFHNARAKGIIYNSNDDESSHQFTTTKHASEEYISLTEFIQQIPEVIKESRRLVQQDDVSYGADNDPITKLFNRVNFSDHEWEPYALFDATRNYTRNLIATDNETFTLLLLCWNPDHASPIHDHPCDGCWMKVCRGQVRECRYEYPDQAGSGSGRKSLQCIHDETYHEGQLAYIADYLGFHKVGNPSEDVPAVTMHLYVPPINECKMWLREDAPPSKCFSSHYSEYGHVLQHTA